MSVYRCLGTPLCFSLVYTKGNHFCDFLFISLDDMVFLKWSSQLLNKRICSSIREKGQK